jgi:cyclopropane fatty-acyl-phospholipid synthase-like methyltransferase
VSKKNDHPSDAYVAVQLDDEYFHLGYWDADLDMKFPSEDEQVRLERLAQERYLDELVKDIPIKKGDTILDIGCGNGTTAIWLAKKFNCFVYGIDIVEKNIIAAEERMKEEKLEDLLCFQQKDALSMDFSAQKFDHVISVETIYHIDNKSKLFENVNSILKPGGRLVFSDYTLERPCSPFLKSLAREIIESKYIIKIGEYHEILTGIGLIREQDKNISAHTIEKLIELERNTRFKDVKDILPDSIMWRITVSLLAPTIVNTLYKGSKKKKLRLNFISYKKPSATEA